MSDNMWNRTGWVPVSCEASDEIRATNGGVYSALTDPDGTYGPGVVYTEWQDADGVPILRDYRWSGDEPCEHLVPAGSVGNEPQ